MKASCWYGSALFGFALIASFSTSIACGKSSCCISKPATREASSDWPASTLSTLRYASRARSISPFSSNAIPSTKRASASALCAACGRNARSGAGFEATESSWRATGFPGWARGTFAGEPLGACASATVAAIRKLSAKKKFRQAQQTQHFFRSLTLNLIFWCGFGKPGTLAAPATANETVPYNLYRSRFLCLCAFIRLRRLCLAIFAFLRFLSEPIQILVTAIRLNHLIHRSASVVADSAIWFLVMARPLPSFILRANADFLQKWFDRLFAAQEFFDRLVDITRIAGLVNFAAQFH